MNFTIYKVISWVFLMFIKKKVATIVQVLQFIGEQNRMENIFYNRLNNVYLIKLPDF